MRYVNIALIVLITAAILLFKFQTLSSVTVSLPNEMGVEQTRVLLRAVRRVVWGSGARHDIKPSTLFHTMSRQTVTIARWPARIPSFARASAFVVSNDFGPL